MEGAALGERRRRYFIAALMHAEDEQGKAEESTRGGARAVRFVVCSCAANVPINDDVQQLARSTTRSTATSVARGIYSRGPWFFRECLPTK